MKSKDIGMLCHGMAIFGERKGKQCCKILMLRFE